MLPGRGSRGYAVCGTGAAAGGRGPGDARSPDAARFLRRLPAVTPDPRQVLGLDGEDAAVHELEARGYAIVARRYRTRLGELDIVARDGRVLVFVEVKTRSTPAFGDGLEAVTADKRRRLVRMAREYLWRNGLDDEPCRFDVVAIDVRGIGRQRRLVVDVIRDAFVDGE